MKASRTSLIFAFAAVAIANLADAAALRIDDLVGTSIGTDFLLDPGFGDAGSTIVDFNDASIVTYASLRLVSDAGHYWLIGRNLTVLGHNEMLAIARLGSDGSPDTTFGIDGYLVAAVDLASITDATRGDAGRFYATGLYRADVGADPQVAVACVEASGQACAGFGSDDG